MKNVFLHKAKQKTASLVLFSMVFSLVSPFGNITFADQITAIAQIEAIVQWEDASSITIEVLQETEATGIISQNLNAYQAAISAAADGDLDTIWEIQAMIDSVNATEAATALATIQWYATWDDASALSIDELIVAWVTWTVVWSLDSYKTVIAGEDAIADLPALQLLIDNVNALVTAIAAAQVQLDLVVTAQSNYTTAWWLVGDQVYIDVTDAKDAVDLAIISEVTVDILSTTVTLTANLGLLDDATDALNVAAADAVETLISNLPLEANLVVANEADVTTARNAYDLLTVDQQDLVLNLATLTVAEEQIADLIAATAAVLTAEWSKTQEDVDAAQLLIDEVTAGWAKTALQDRLNDVQDIVDAIAAAQIELALVNTAQSNYTTAWGNIGDQVYIDVTDAKDAVDLAIISEVTVDILSTTATLTTNIGLLDDATDALNVAAADAVETLITNLPLEADLTLADTGDVEAARTAFDALTVTQQGLVTNIAVLITAEEQIADLTAADAAVTTAEWTPTQWNIDSAQTLINEVTAWAAKTALQDRLNDVQDIVDADVVIALINALPLEADLTLADTGDVEAARTAFDALTVTQQGLVTNIAVLITAEEQIADLTAADAAVTTAEWTPTQWNIDSAQTLINEVTAWAAKTALQDRLNDVQDIVDADVAADSALTAYEDKVALNYSTWSFATTEKEAAETAITAYQDLSWNNTKFDGRKTTADNLNTDKQDAYDDMVIAKSTAASLTENEYTSDSWTDLEDALNLVEVTMQNQIDKTTAINDAIAALKIYVTINSDETSLKAGETANISFTLSKSSSNFTLEDITVVWGSLSSFSGSWIWYTVVFTPNTNSTTTWTINILSNTFTDADGHDNVEADEVSINIDTLYSVISSIVVTPTNTWTGATYTFNVNETSTGIIYVWTGSDVMATLVGSGETTKTGSATHTGTINDLISWIDYYYYIKATDLAGNVTNSLTWTFSSADTAAPVVFNKRVDSITSTTATVKFDFTDANYTVWTGPKTGTGYISIGTWDSYTNVVENWVITVATWTTNTASKIFGSLSANTKYNYSISITDNYGNVSTASTGSFVTASAPIDLESDTTSTWATTLTGSNVTAGSGLTLSGSITVESDVNDSNSITWSLVLSWVTLITVSGGTWNGVIIPPTLVQSWSTENATNNEISTVVPQNTSVLNGNTTVTTTYTSTILQTVKLGWENWITLTSSWANFRVSFVVPNGTVWTTLKLYRSVDWTTWEANSPDTTCTLDSNKFCTFETNHLSYFAPTLVTSATSMVTNNSWGSSSSSASSWSSWSSWWYSSSSSSTTATNNNVEVNTTSYVEATTTSVILDNKLSLTQLKDIIKGIKKQSVSTKNWTVQISIPEFDAKIQIIIEGITKSYVKKAEKAKLTQKANKEFFEQYSTLLLGLKLHIEKDPRWIEIAKIAMKKMNTILKNK